MRTGATQLVLEELLMTDVQMHPFELLSWEGVFGTIFMVFALLTFNAIPGVPRREPGLAMWTVRTMALCKRLGSAPLRFHNTAFGAT